MLDMPLFNSQFLITCNYLFYENVKAYVFISPQVSDFFLKSQYYSDYYS